MVNQSKWYWLQLFAGEGAGGTCGSGADGGAGSAAAGVESADAGHQRLRELGVPENRIRKNRAYKVDVPAAKPAATQEAEPQQVAAAQEETKPTEEKPARMSWEEIKKDPEYNAEIQKIIQARLREEGQNKAILQTLDPALKALAKEHGLDPENLDHEALVKAVTGEYDNKAIEMGVSAEVVRQLDQQQRTIEQQKMINHMQKLEQESAALKQTFPNFDLRTEMQNPTFARLVSPNVNLSVEDAYHAVHRREIQAASMQVAAQKTAQQISEAIQSGSRRPDESGSTAQAPSVTTFDYRRASRAEREALKQQIRQAAARGEKIYPGR